jgi:hypothetical protein
MEVATFALQDSSYGYRRESEAVMAQSSDEIRPDAERKAELEVRPAPSSAATDPKREAMSWIRALANDWEDERSHSELTK